MKIYFFCFILLLGFTTKAQEASVKWATQETFFEELIGKDLPYFKGLRTNRKMFSKTSLNNQIVVINFWFENCPPCIAEMPELNKLVEKYAKKGVRFIGITHDAPISAKHFQTKNDYQYEIVSLSKVDIAKLNINHGFPSNILVDKNGKIIAAMANISYVDQEFKERSVLFEQSLLQALGK